MIKSRYFTYEELTKSPTAIRHGVSNDIVYPAHLKNMQALVTNVLDPLRKIVGRPITVNSGYRSLAVNKLVGGSTSSQHSLGEAADIECPGMSNHKLAETIATCLKFDQLILEFYTPGIPDSGWVHVSYRQGHNRRQVLRAYRKGKATAYENYYFN